MSFCKAAILGNLGNDPDTKYTPSGTMLVELSIAVNNPKDKTAPPTWYRITAWDRLAERLDKLAQAGHIVKGRTLYVEGALQPRSYTDKNGNPGISFDVTMTDFQFTGGGQQQGEQVNQNTGEITRQQPAQARPQQAQGNPMAGYEQPSADFSDLPF